MTGDVPNFPASVDVHQAAMRMQRQGKPVTMAALEEQTGHRWSTVYNAVRYLVNLGHMVRAKETGANGEEIYTV